MAADTFQIKRGTTAAVNAYLPAVGEPVYDITLKQFKIGDGVTLGGVAPLNVLTADKLTTARNIAISGMLTGSASFDGSANVSINTSVAAPLQTLLDAKANVTSPTLLGVPLTPTAAVDTNSTQIASTAYVVGQAGSATPVVDGTGAVGVSLRYSRQDHVHPTDTSRAPLASPTFTGVPAAPTAAIGTNTTQLATMAALQARILGTVSQSAGVPTGTILETGGTQTGTGTYIKMADGTLIMHKTLSIATGSTTAKGAIFGSAATSAGAMPITLVGNFAIQYSGTDNAGGGWAAQDIIASNSTWGSYSTRNHVSAGTAGTITLLAIGRWF